MREGRNYGVLPVMIKGTSMNGATNTVAEKYMD